MECMNGGQDAVRGACACAYVIVPYGAWVRGTAWQHADERVQATYQPANYGVAGGGSTSIMPNGFGRAPE